MFASISDDKIIESAKKEIQLHKNILGLQEAGLEEEITRHKFEILILNAQSRLFNQIFDEIDSVKVTLQGMGVKTKEIEEKIENREEVFRKIDEYTAAMAKPYR